MLGEGEIKVCQVDINNNLLSTFTCTKAYNAVV